MKKIFFTICIFFLKFSIFSPVIAAENDVYKKIDLFGEVLEKINKLESSQIWRSSALEMKAFLKLKQNKVEEARKIFEGILNLSSTPSSLATRAKNMVDYLKD